MNFTREPVIETVIVPREGCRLVLRSSKNDSQEEFTVDAVEIVSFGHALFYRCLEKPRPFLVPVSDYEVVEAKESRVVLKNAPVERTIKIGGGREGSLRKEEEEEDQVLPIALEEEVADESPTQPQPSHDKKRDRGRRNRRRRALEERDEMRHRVEEQTAAAPSESRESKEHREPKPAAPKEPQPFTHLIPPPTTLISHNIQKYKDQQSGQPPQESEPKREEEPKSEPNGESTPISRVALESPSMTTSFTTLEGWNPF
ncbi:MAG: hypothetical protein JSS10_01760 [Verrucomicrobia bacterium]|nr:hypothetical protein [Verrucomicrobiota bacterium]